MGGGGRPKPGDRPGPKEDRSVDRRGRRRAGSRRRYPGSARPARDDRGAAAPLGLHGPARRGAPRAGAVRLLRRLDPRAARRQVRQAGQHHQDLAAPCAHRNPGVSRVMTDDADTLEMLAAEYVLGTLAADERAQAEALLASDPAFARLVRDWERRLGELHAMVQPVEPPPEIWAGITARLDGIAPGAAAGSNVVDLTRRLGRWRQAAAALGAIAAVLLAVVVTAAFDPQMLPGPVRPKPIEIVRTVTKGGNPGRFV